MLLRRLYSSLPQRATASPATAPTPKAVSRGRTRPTRVQVQRVKPVLPESSSSSHGRRLRRASVLAASDRVSSELPRPVAPGFQPVTLYPFQAGLHLSFTPPHMPLPVHNGTKGYLSVEKDASAPLFERPAPPSPLEGVRLTAASPLAEHLSLTKAFSHPALVHHLGEAPSTSLRAIDVDGDSRLHSMIEEAESAHSRIAADAWDAALQRLGVSATPAPKVSAAEQANIDDAIAGLTGLLARLEAGAEAEPVSLDSVRRKRKKKMNKHKHKKRRKATYAQRRRLGK